MGGPYNTPPGQASFSISPRNRLPEIPEIVRAAGLLKEGVGPVMHVGRIRITSQAWPQFPALTWALVLA
jgi:hypothetical protein